MSFRAISCFVLFFAIGGCVEDCELEDDRSCWADGVYYDAGTSNIPSPYHECGTCTCQPSGLSCIPLPCEEECEVGATCGSECAPEDDSCAACGTMRYNEQCVCVANEGLCPPAQSECEQPGAAQLGEACGSYWWCNRPCAEGLECMTNDPCSGDFRSHCVPKDTAEPACDGHAACTVGELTYASGSIGIADPIRCNRCGCTDGALLCTEIACPIDCPEEPSPGSACTECPDGGACASPGRR